MLITRTVLTYLDELSRPLWETTLFDLLVAKGAGRICPGRFKCLETDRQQGYEVRHGSCHQEKGNRPGDHVGQGEQQDKFSGYKKKKSWGRPIKYHPILF
jgi:hypothetical protein